MKKLSAFIGGLSMKTKTALTVSMVFLFFVGILAMVTLRQIERLYEEAIYKQQTAIVDAMVDSVDGRLRLTRSALEKLAAGMSSQLLRSSEKSQTFLDAQTSLLEIFDNGLLLISEDGKVIAEAPHISGGRGRSVTHTDAFKGVTLSGSTHISKPFASIRAKGRPVISIAVPLIRDGVRVGRLHGSFELMGRNFLADLVDFKIGRTGYAFLSTVDRILVLHPDRTRIMTPAPPAGQNVVYDRSLVERAGSGRTVTSRGVPMLVSFQRVPTANWILGVNYPQNEAFEPYYRARRWFLWGLVAGTGLVLLAVWLLMQRLTVPLRAMTRHVESLAEKAGDDRFIRSTTGDEIGTLGNAFDDMLVQLDAKEQNLRDANLSLDRRVQERTAALQAANADLERAVFELQRTQQHLVQNEKMSALGALVAGVAHEINTPLGISVTAVSFLEERIRGLANLFGDDKMSREELQAFLDTSAESVSIALANLNRAVELIRSFKQVAVDQAGSTRRKFFMNDYLKEVLLSLKPQLAHVRHQVRLDCPEQLSLFGRPGDYSQIVTNLVMNSLVHGFDGVEAGHIDIRVEETAAGMVIRYRDDGRGIAPENLDRIFDPFFTTRRGQGGSGLGLHVVYNIVCQGLGGSIQCRSQPGQGVEFEIHVPRSAMQEFQGDETAAVPDSA